MASLKTFFLYALIFYVGLVACLYVLQRSLIYYPHTGLPHFPDIKGADYIIVTTQDGLALQGWYARSRKGKPTLLWFHGNAGHIAHRFILAKPYIEAGYGVLLAGYRGYGGNPGRPSEQGLYQDGRAYLDFLIRKQSVAPENIILYGESLGSGVAVQMALEFPFIRALVLVTPMENIASLVQSHFPFIPADLLLKDRFDNMAKMPGLTMPIAIYAAGRDEVIPPAQAHVLHGAVLNPAGFHVFEEASHNTLDPAVLAEKIRADMENR